MLDFSFFYDNNGELNRSSGYYESIMIDNFYYILDISNNNLAYVNGCDQYNSTLPTDMKDTFTVIGHTNNLFDRTYTTVAILFLDDLIDNNIARRSLTTASITELLIPFTVKYIGNAQYMTMSTLQTIDISLNNNLEEIGDSAFKYCGSLSLTDNNIFNNLKIIGDYAFQKCTNLCRNINTLNITSNNLLYIGKNCFEQIDASSVTVNNTNPSCIVSKNIFANCSKLTEVNFTNQVVKINNLGTIASIDNRFNNIFYNCSKLNSFKCGFNTFNIQDSVNYSWVKMNLKINGTNHFDSLIYSNKITSIISSIKSYEEDLSNNILTLTDILINNHLISSDNLLNFDGEYSFSDIDIFTGGTAINVPSLTNIFGGDIIRLSNTKNEHNYFIIFDGTTQSLHENQRNQTNKYNISYDISPVLNNIENNNRYLNFNLNQINNIASVTGISAVLPNISNIYIPAFVTDSSNNIYAVNISNGAFRDNVNLTSVNIEKGLHVLGSNTFSGCTSLSNVVIPDGIEKFNDNLFYNCINISSIRLPNTLISIGVNCFRGCRNLANISFPNTLTEIGDNAFAGCILLNSVVIPDNVTSLGSHCFANCYGLLNVSIGCGIDTIPGHCFSYDSSLNNVSLPKNLKIIGNYAFNGCSSLLNIEIPNNVGYFRYNYNIFGFGAHIPQYSIGENAFEGCSNLTTVNIPFGIDVLPNKLFFDCSNITSINIPDSVTNIGTSVFENCHSLSYNIPRYIERIESRAFYMCDVSTNIVFPKTLTYTGNSSFSYSGVNELIINPVNDYQNFAFANCQNLQKAYISDQITKVSQNAFSNCSNLNALFFY